MARMTDFVFNEAEFKRLCGQHGEVGQYVIGLGRQVVNEAIQNATHRPGPRIRSGDLVEQTQMVVGTNENGVLTVDIGSSAEHRGFNYPSALETGEYNGPPYPWLRPALVRVIERN